MYRLWFVYGRRMRILWFPVFLWVGGFVCTILEIFLQVVHVHNPNFGPYQWASVDMHTGPGIVLIPFWLSTIVLNAYCTGKSAENLVMSVLMFPMLRSSDMENLASNKDGRCWELDKAASIPRPHSHGVWYFISIGWPSTLFCVVRTKRFCCRLTRNNRESFSSRPISI